jgi:SsrA-binding protein
MEKKINIKNKKAGFNYELLEKYIAGIKLSGTEIKPIRGGKANLVDSYCQFRDNELWVRGMHIAEYEYGTYNNHHPIQERKLLLTKKELFKLERKSKDAGTTIIATRLFVNDRGWAKVEIALARGKKQFDKREDIKKKDLKRQNDRILKV